MSNKETQIKSILKSLNQTQTVLNSFKKISNKHANIIQSKDVIAKDLSKKNLARMNIFKDKLTDPTINELFNIMHTNFEIIENNLDIIRAYADEFYDRFKHLEASLSPLLL